MAKRRVSDRNTVVFGPLSTNVRNLQRELDDLQQQTTQNQQQVDTVSNQLSQFAAPTTPTEQAAIFYGTIQTYDQELNGGNLTRTSTGETLSYLNASGSALGSGDTVAVTQESGSGGYIVIAIVQRQSPYAPVPQEYLRIVGYPTDGLQIETGVGGASAANRLRLPVIYDKDGELGLGPQTLVSVDGQGTWNGRLVARCAGTGFTYDLGEVPGLTGTSVQSDRYGLYPVRCGEYIVVSTFELAGTSAEDRLLFVWDFTNGWRSWDAGDSIRFHAQVTVDDNEGYAVVSVGLSSSTNGYKVLRLSDLVIVDSGTIAGTGTDRIAYGGGPFAWSNSGHTGTFDSWGVLTWSSTPKHTLNAPNDGYVGYFRCAVDPVDGTFYQARSSGGKWLLTRYSFTTAAATSIDIIGDGSIPELVPLDISGVRASGDGTVMVAANQKQQGRTIKGILLSAQVSSNIATLVTAQDLLACGLLPGDALAVSGVGAPFDGEFVIQGVTDVTVSYPLTAADQGPIDLTALAEPAFALGVMDSASFVGSEDEGWPYIYITDFNSETALFADFAPYTTTAFDPIAWDIPGSDPLNPRTTQLDEPFFVGIAADKGAKVYVVGYGDAPVSTYAPGGFWCLIDAYDTI
jgi:hypothetical protein